MAIHTRRHCLDEGGVYLRVVKSKIIAGVRFTMSFRLWSKDFLYDFSSLPSHDWSDRKVDQNQRSGSNQLQTWDGNRFRHNFKTGGHGIKYSTRTTTEYFETGLVQNYFLLNGPTIRPGYPLACGEVQRGVDTVSYWESAPSFGMIAEGTKVTISQRTRFGRISYHLAGSTILLG